MLSDLFKIAHLWNQIVLNLVNGILQYVGWSHKHIGRINGEVIKFFFDAIVDRVKAFYRLNFVAKKMDFKCMIGITRKNIYNISHDTKGSM